MGTLFLWLHSKHTSVLSALLAKGGAFRVLRAGLLQEFL